MIGRRTHVNKSLMDWHDDWAASVARMLQGIGGEQWKVVQSLDTNHKIIFKDQFVHVLSPFHGNNNFQWSIVVCVPLFLETLHAWEGQISVVQGQPCDD